MRSSIKEQMTVCMIVIKIPYNLPSLRANLKLRARSVDIRASFRCFSLSVSVLPRCFGVGLLSAGSNRAHDL